ncbi:glycosyltransferase family 87 protein [Celeribacter sp.]|uniref:glycosyltransferase family 87 protein n=1 Tax=Celeribacter sp. TaxID=1890673 RepID=UPI003A8EDD2B
MKVSTQKWYARADYAGTAIILAFVYMVYYAWLLRTTFANDLSAIYAAGLAVAAGIPDAMYDAGPYVLGTGTPERVAALLDAAGIKSNLTPPYLYPPIWAYLMAPATRVMEIQTFFNIMLAIQAFMLGLMPWMGYRIVRPKRLPAPAWLAIAFALLITSTPTLTAIIQNQLQMTVTFVTILSLLAFARGKSVTAGIILGLAAALKISPTFFVLLFIIKRDMRATLAMVISSLSLLALSIALGGVQLHLTMLERLGTLDEVVLISKVNFSPEAAAYELRRLILDIPAEASRLFTFPVLDAPAWVSAIPKVGLLLTLGTLIVTQIRRPQPFGFQILYLGLAVALFGPLSWSHYFILPMMFFPVLFDDFRTRTAMLWVGVFAIIHLSDVFFIINSVSTEYIWSQMPSTAYFLLLLGTLLVVAVKRAREA